MNLVATGEIGNTWLQVCEFELQITMYYVQSTFVCLVNKVHGQIQISPFMNIEKLVNWAQQLYKAWNILVQFFFPSCNIQLLWIYTSPSFQD